MAEPTNHGGRRAVELSLRQVGCAGYLVGDRWCSHLQQVAVAVGHSGVVVQDLDASGADRDVDLAVAPGPAEGVGHHHRDIRPAVRADPLTRVGANGGPNVAVVVTDTLGRAWRNGQVDIAIGAAGIEVLHDYAGMPDGYGNLLEVTAPAVADEIAGAADLAKGKLDGTPAAVVRGLGHLVTAPGVHGSGASALIRDEGQDMFGYGTREAVLQALHQDPLAQRGFGAAASSEEMVAALRGCCPDAGVRVAEGGAARVDVLLTGSASPPAQRALGADEARVTAVAFAMGWRVAQAPVAEAGPDVVLRFSAPSP